MERTPPDVTAISPTTPAGRWLRSFWQPVYLADRLAAGRAVPLHILGEDFTLYRGESGTAHLIGARCAHRGLLLSAGRVKGERIECFYHGWTYDGSGRCVAQPAEKNSGSADKIRIGGYPTREYLGLIFVYLGAGDPPELPRFDAYARDGFIEAKESRRDWSFFSQLENSVDEVHFNFTHRKSKFTDVGLNDEIPEVSAEETDYGILRLGRRGNRLRKSHILMPNCMYSMVFEHWKGWSEHLAWRVPIDDRSHVSFMVDCVHKEGADAEEYRRVRAEHRAQLATLEPADRLIDRILAGELHADDVAYRPDIVLIQDGVALKGQGARDRRQDRLGASDHQVALLRRIWLRELQALDDGRPIKRWRVPVDLAPTTGTNEEPPAR
jgi:5,5'-dehydrodivanillate O-demethylase oxygenase subunit